MDEYSVPRDERRMSNDEPYAIGGVLDRGGLSRRATTQMFRDSPVRAPMDNIRRLPLLAFPVIILDAAEESAQHSSWRVVQSQRAKLPSQSLIEMERLMVMPGAGAVRSSHSIKRVA